MEEKEIYLKGSFIICSEGKIGLRQSRNLELVMHVATVEPISVGRLAVGMSDRKIEFDIHGHR